MVLLCYNRARLHGYYSLIQVGIVCINDPLILLRILFGIVCISLPQSFISRKCSKNSFLNTLLRLYCRNRRERGVHFLQQASELDLKNGRVRSQVEVLFQAHGQKYVCRYQNGYRQYPSLLGV